MNITLFNLSQKFPQDTIWRTNRSEIVGYSFSENRHIVIDNGLCKSENGEYLVHEYRPSNPTTHLHKFATDEYPYKYLLDDLKIREEWVKF